MISNIHQTTPHASRHELSREVHRAGIHFPTSVVAQVCNHYGIRLTRDGRLIDEDKNDKLFMKVYQKGQLVLDEKVQDQVTVNTEAKDIIKDLFPNIPDQDLFKIIKTAFQLGDGKVGTAEEIPLHRRASLSVVAHIRHVYTKYDKLLRKMPYNNARHEVEAQTLQKLVEWRGDSNADEGAINDILDDVIVISDGEASDTELEGVQQIRPADVRVEELDGNAYWPAPARPMSPSRVVFDDTPPGYRPLPRAVEPYRLSDAELAARERSRAARWEQARQDYRTALSQPGPSHQRVLVREPSPVRHMIPLDPPQPHRVIERQYLGPSQQMAQEVEVGDRPTSISKMTGGFNPLSYLPATGDTDGGQVLSRPGSPRFPRPTEVRYERIVDDYRGPPPVLQSQSRPYTPIGSRYRRRSASPGGSDSPVLPSIEGPGGAYSPSFARQNEDARAHNQQFAVGYRERRDCRPHAGNPAVDIENGSGQPRARWNQGEVLSSNAPNNPFHSPREPPKMFRDMSPPITEAEPRPLEPYSAGRRILVPEDDVRYDQTRSQPPLRSHPFEDRYVQRVRHLEPQTGPRPYDVLRRPNPETPPRRILEPISTNDPYSDTGPQRYREHIAPSGPYFGSAPPSAHPLSERQIVYTNQPQSYVVERHHDRGVVAAPYPAPTNGFARYEPLPEIGYARR